MKWKQFDISKDVKMTYSEALGHEREQVQASDPQETGLWAQGSNSAYAQNERTGRVYSRANVDGKTGYHTLPGAGRSWG